MWQSLDANDWYFRLWSRLTTPFSVDSLWFNDNHFTIPAIYAIISGDLGLQTMAICKKKWYCFLVFSLLTEPWTHNTSNTFNHAMLYTLIWL